MRKIAFLTPAEVYSKLLDYMVSATPEIFALAYLGSEEREFRTGEAK